MKTYNFKIVDNGKTYFQSISAYHLINALLEVKGMYPKGSVTLL